MKKIALISFFSLIAAIGFGQQYSNILSVGPLSNSPGYFYIDTKIRYYDDAAPQVHITGYNYAQPNNAIKLTISWYKYSPVTGFYWTEFKSDIGYYCPSRIRLGTYDDNGTTRVRIEIANDGVYWSSFFVSATDAVGSSTYYSGWSSHVGEFPSGTGDITNVIQHPGFIYSNNGNVGIDATLPSAKLQINNVLDGTKALHISSSSTDGSLFVENTWGSYAGTLAQIAASGRADNSAFNLFKIDNATGNKFTVRGDGNIGIGTTTPANMLDVRKNQSTYTYITVDNAGSVGAGTGAGFAMGEGGTLYNALRSERDGTGALNLINGGSGAINFKTGASLAGATAKVTILNTGTVGIGTPFPLELLDVSKSNSTGVGGRLQISNYGTLGAGNAAELTFAVNSNFTSGYYSGRITVTTPTADNVSNTMIFALYDGITPAGSEKMRISSVGNVGIGTANPAQKLDVNGNAAINGKVFIGNVDPSYTGPHLLAVNGSAIFTKVKVKLYGSQWPDYVFDKDYKLQPLSRVESFIKKNKHLPEVPSAKEIDENGIDVSEMQIILLKKIEELTLYQIEQNKKNIEQQKVIDELTVMVKKLRQQIQQQKLK